MAILGSGGKTTLLHRLGGELAAHFPRVLLTSLTKAGIPESDFFLLKDLANSNVSPLFKKSNPLELMEAALDKRKLLPVSEQILKKLYAQADVCIVECDGARNLPLKVHRAHDPVVPSFTTQVIVIVGAEVLGTTLRDGLVHRPKLFQEFWGIKDTDVLNSRFVADVVTSKRGYGCKIQSEASVVYYVNKADVAPERARELAMEIRERTGQSVYYGSLLKGYFSECA